MSELRFDGVAVRFGTGGRALTAVDGVDLTIPSGQVVGLVGESGSGKSTLARAAVGLTEPSSGQILLDGVPLRYRAGERRPLQMVFQDPYSSLDPRMTVGDSIAEAVPRSAHLLGVGRRRGAGREDAGREGIGRQVVDRRREVGRLLELVGLDAERALAYPGALSGGQRQRVAIARALAGQPDVLIADEITSALDVSIQGTVLNLVRSLQRELRLSMLFISHNLAVVRYVSDIIAVMYLGRIVEVGPAQQLLNDPQHPYTKELLAAAPRRGTTSLQPPDPTVADAEPADPHHPPVGCRFHPRCPIGPLVRTDREHCLTIDPTAEADRRLHRTACHHAAGAPQTAMAPHTRRTFP
ncbi:ABC transporter ATP-binding protein [Kribbella catacumbae]|uniref:ABC transporter ATP-binding protein n=1 Tax=Kribbella catacumbae TaxID=460086 RepID=UPI00037215B6|nr:ABC transporter ATP-binding protein [Kribbella catacumbae]